MTRRRCYCADVFGSEFAAILEECPETWCGLKNYHEAVQDLKRLDSETFARYQDALEASLRQMSELWRKKRGRNRTGGVVERLLRAVLSQAGLEVLKGSELIRTVATLDGLFRPDLAIRSLGKVTIIESTTWANPDKVRADFFKGYVATKRGYRLLDFVAGLEARLEGNDPGFQKVVHMATSEGYVSGVWGIRSLKGFLDDLNAAF